VGKHYLAIQAIGKDKRGLVAAITEVVCVRFGCSIEGSTMSIVGGHFASNLIASSPEAIDAGSLKEGLHEVGGDLELHVSPLAEGDFRRAWRDATHEVAVATTERPGLVHEISHALFDQGVDIVFLASSCHPRENRSTVMVACIPPEDMGSKQLETLLGERLPGSPTVQVMPVRIADSQRA